MGPAGADGTTGGAARLTVPDLAERMGAFRSLGNNCEFGFVQRYAGAEPSGLFRFSYTPLDGLVDALDTDFTRYGAPGDLELFGTETGTYYCRSRCYNVWSNTQQRVDAIDRDTLLEREYGRVAHLKAKMLGELAAGAKILVRKAAEDETESDFERLARAVWRHGPSTLLRVSEGGPGSAAALTRSGERVLEGRLPRFAPQEQAWDLDLEPWVALCDAAYAAHHGLPPAGLVQPMPPAAMDLPGRTKRHRGRHREPKLSAFTRLIDPARFDPAMPYVFSAWVWIPRDAAPERIFAVMGRERLGWRDADLTVRERWQRVWAGGRVGTGTLRPSVGLGLVGTGDRFRSRGWRVHAGAIPVPEPPPPEPLWPALIRRWGARR